MRPAWIAVLLVGLALAGSALGAAVMSIDLGSEWLKVKTRTHAQFPCLTHTTRPLPRFARWASSRRACPWRSPSTRSPRGKRPPSLRSATAIASSARTPRRLDCASPIARTATSSICWASASTIPSSSCTAAVFRTTPSRRIPTGRPSSFGPPTTRRTPSRSWSPSSFRRHANQRRQPPAKRSPSVC